VIVYFCISCTVSLYGDLIRSVKTMVLRFRRIMWSDFQLSIGSPNLWENWSFIMNLLTITNNHDTGSFPRQHGELLDLSHFQGAGMCQLNCDSLLIAFAITESFQVSSLQRILTDYVWQDVKCQLMHHVTG